MPVQDIGGGQVLADFTKAPSPLDQAKDVFGLVDLANRIQQAPADLAKKQADAIMAQHQVQQLGVQDQLQQADLASKVGQESRARSQAMHDQLLSLPEVFNRDFESGRMYFEATFPGARVKKNDDGTFSGFIPTGQGVYTITIPNQKIDDPQKLAEVEKGVREQWMQSPSFKGYQVVNEFYRNFNDTIKLGTGAGDLSAMFSYIKMLDRNNQVREGQQVSAGDVPGLSERFRNWYNYALSSSGERLGPMDSQTRTDFTSAAQKLYGNSKDDAFQQAQFFANLSKRSYMDPRNIVVPVGEITPDSVLQSLQPQTPAASNGAAGANKSALPGVPQSFGRQGPSPLQAGPFSTGPGAAPPPPEPPRFKTTDDLLRNNLFKNLPGRTR
jgi:hypothetical protein